jgi:GYF domain 2
MSYTIIGGDGKQYGPISDADVSKWISEGRLNARSLAKAESDAEFRPLSAFPEFAGVFAPPPPLPGAPPFGVGDNGHQAALQRIKSPAVALMVTAILNLLFGAWSLLEAIFFPPNLQQYNAEMQQLNNPQLEQFMHMLLQMTHGPFAIAANLLGLALSVLILMGAIKMKSLRSYEFSMTAAIVAMLPCVTPCCIIGLPIGIWALVVLRSPAVKSHFH